MNKPTLNARRIPRGGAELVRRRLTPEPERALPADPVAWVRDQLSEHLWSAQARILRALTEHRKVAVQSCHQVGKSFIAARAGLWWIAAHPIGEAVIVTTAPSGDQVRSILWGEKLRGHRKGALPGQIVLGGSTPEWKINGQQVGFGRKPSDYVDLSKARTQFQGIHARYLLGILDEGCGIPKWLFEAMDTLATNEMSRLLVIGNPDDPTTEFAKKCSPGSGWHVISISAFDSPNFTNEAVPEHLRESLISRRWVEDTERDYGIDSPYYISKVLGLFPEVADDVIISPKLIREAHERDCSGHAIKGNGRYGMDVAEYGEDETCVYLNRGGMIRLVDAWRKADVDSSARKAAEILDERLKLWPITVDSVGLGAGVAAPLANRNYRVRRFNGGEAANDADRFTNRNGEAWWAFREGLEAGLIDLDPDDEVLAAQLQSRKWKLDAAQRRIRVETKEEMAKRGHRSPDRADAAVMSYYEGGRTVDDPSVVLNLGADRKHHDPGDLAGDLLSAKW